MSSSNTLTVLDPSQLNIVLPSVTNGTVGLTHDRTFIVADDQGNGYLHNTNVDVEIGNARDISISTSVRNTYPARYNFAVKQYNSLPDENVSPKKQMRGGHFFMYRWVMILAFLVVLLTAGISIKIKPLITVSIVISLIYIILSIYNIIIFKHNGILFSHRMIHDNDRTKNNAYYKVPINTSVTQTNALASAHPDIVAGLREKYNHLTEITVMVFNEYYIRTFTRLPRKRIIIHITSFSMIMILGIILAVAIKI